MPNFRAELLLAELGEKISTADELAAKVGVCVRTVYRYVRELRAAGHPIMSEAGVGYMMRRREIKERVCMTPTESMTHAFQEELRKAAVEGWKACRRQVYGLSEDYIDRTHALKSTDTVEGNFYRGQYDAAKGFGKAFGAFEAEDCDEFKKIDFAAMVSAVVAVVPTVSEDRL
ncbi:helix-turn-helix domain-containing protein [Mesorhizobium silamurunense]|uniref:helix-turn-helix domain-containing protein n=1 Tax=Mesorhizobium silamurunense TaxID=499528 RepID=UPI0017822146|nr:helix-turn-helix domain-containing protein [Mesorhizobium silamurunense]